MAAETYRKSEPTAQVESMAQSLARNWFVAQDRKRRAEEGLLSAQEELENAVREENSCWLSLCDESGRGSPRAVDLSAANPARRSSK